MSSLCSTGRRLLLLGLAVGAIACALTETTPRPPGSGSEGKSDEWGAAGKGLQLTGSFDGSQNYRMWTATMELARQLRASTQREVHFSYFINGKYYTEDGVSGPAERLVRIALTQQAINEGHDIGSHGMLHEDGGGWTTAQWAEDFRRMDELVGRMLFEPFPASGETGAAVFPRWQAVAGVAAGEPGASCTSDGECRDALCVPVAPGQRFCSRECDRDSPCPAGLGCGGGVWSQFYASGQHIRDLCLPVPAFPVVHQGVTLFEADGQPTAAALQQGLLRPYRMVGVRAPYLAAPATMWQAMFDRGYRYDASQVARSWQNPNVQIAVPGRSGTLWSFGIMTANTDDRTLTWGTYGWPMPFDSVYSEFRVPADEMERQYRASILALHERRASIPAWNINGHFSWWLRDASGRHYWEVFQQVFTWAAQGCPDAASGLPGCTGIGFPSFRELADLVAAD